MNKQNIVAIIVRTIFFVFFFLYLLYRANPAISYFTQQPIFLFDKVYLLNYLNHPGGVTEYLSQFLSQFYYFTWMGAIIITIVVLAVTYLTYKNLKTLGVKRYVLLLQLLPAIALVFLHGTYEYKLDSSLVLLFSTLTFFHYLRTTRHKFIYRVFVLILSSVVLHYLSGGDALLIYLSMCLALELVNIKDFKSFILADTIIIIALIIPYLSARLIFYINLKEAYLHLLAPEENYHPSHILYGLYIFFPILIAYTRFSEYLSDITQIKIIPRKLEKNMTLIKPETAIQFLAIIILTILTFTVPFKSEQKLIDRVKFMAHTGEWESLLEAVRDNPSDNRLIYFHRNRALYHTGELAGNLFKYPHNLGKYGLLMEGVLSVVYLMDNSDLYFDMGHIGSAQHWAYEAQTKFENSPRVLKRLALTNIINGDFGSAKSILNILKKSMLHRKWAEYYHLCITDPLKLDEDPIIQSKRKIQPSDDFFLNDILEPYKDLQFIVEENIRNRMAFEYLMAYYLLDKDLASFINYLPYLTELDHKVIPVNYQEALLYYVSIKDAKRIDLSRYKLNRNIVDRYRDYAGIVLKNNGDLEAAKDELNKNYSDTYWYYAHYIKPAINKEEIKTYSKK
ncbi:MAG: hypothetical protein JSV22_12820 [Bacteroidales bacterium]|nr:MAG: hypothetical protein JSV22_12820 [Bacteroidales bacterium]